MRTSGTRWVAGLSVAVSVFALLAMSGSALRAAALLAGPSVSVGPRMSAPSFNPTFRATEPRFQRFNRGPDKIVVDDDKPRSRHHGKIKGGRSVATGSGDDRPGRRPPGKPPVKTGGWGGPFGFGALIATTAAGGAAVVPPAGGGSSPPGTPPTQRIDIPPAGEDRFVKDEVILEFAANFPQPGIAQLLARHRLVQLERQTFGLSNSTFVRARIADRRPVRVALQSLGNETILRAAQPNYLYQASQQANPVQPEAAAGTPAAATAAAVPVAADPRQYVLGKLHLNEAHALATGDRILVAVIDSGIDFSHPELAGAVAGAFDALGKHEKPHVHGTAIAGAIAAHAKLMGAAPAAKILAIRAFSAQGGSAEGTSMAILKGVEIASEQHSRIINMSFAGPSDPALSRALAAAKARGAVLIAAAGNFGPKSPPQYPAADPDVIAVSATDADDRIFRMSNIGPHVAVTAPGVDLLLPAPGNDYRMMSGTSFSAAYVSGTAALILQRAPALTPDGIREVLEKTAKDFGAPGPDPQFGAGLVDAYAAAVMAAQPPTASAAPELAATPKAQ